MIFLKFEFQICAYIQGVPKKERHFQYIYKIANNQNMFLKIKLTTHNYICGQMSKYEVCILNIQ